MSAKQSISPGDMILVAVPVLALFPLHNNDLWWHLAAGRWIVEHRAIPRADVFSWTHYLGAWIDNEWLSELLFFATSRIGGEVALIALRALLFAVLAILLRIYMAALRIPSSFAAAIATVVALSHHWWELRPSAFSLIGMLVLLIVMERVRFAHRGASKALWFVPLLFAVWANVHPGFVFGLVVFAAITVAAAIDPLTAHWKRTGLEAGSLAFVLFTSAAATLVNPYGWRVYVQQVSIAGNRTYRMLLDEWIVPSPAFLLVVVAAMVIALAKVRMIPLHRLAAFIAAATLSMTAVRFVEYFAWITVPLLFTFVAIRRRRPWAELAVVVLALCVGWFPPAAKASDVRTAFYIATAARQHRAAIVASSIYLLGLMARGGRYRLTIPVAALSAVAVAAMGIALMPPDGTIERGRYPGACLTAIPTDARVFNRFSWGGWLIWRRGLPVFIDGRCSGQPLFFEYVAAQVRYARAVLDRWQADWVIAASDDGVVAQLSSTPEWSVVCRDDAALVFRRNSLVEREFSP